MSHALGFVYKDGHVLGYVVYNGTCDMMCSNVFRTHEEAWDALGEQAWKSCGCNAPPTEVILYSHYGGGFHWPGKVCFTCMCLVDGHEPIYGTDGTPDGIALPWLPYIDTTCEIVGQKRLTDGTEP